jgi:NAD(P)-dependent dehydrogenase (short-subunit alcohol dehydrogenase family)
VDIVWITGASSGMGAALAEHAPSGARVIGVSRRPPPRGEHLPADLADPQAWRGVGAQLQATLARERPSTAALLHMAGALDPFGAAETVAEADLERSVLLNAAAGQMLGASFLRACARENVRPTVVMCSSPAASAPRPGAAQYCAGKAALEMWARTVALEQADRPDPAVVFAVVPYGVDTPMVRAAMDAPSAQLPMGEMFRAAAAEGRLARPEDVAQEIWALVAAPPAPGEAVAVGAVPA